MFIFMADIDKAYNSLNWNDLDNFLDAIRLIKNWRCWVRACLDSGSKSILVDGAPRKKFPHNRVFFKQILLHLSPFLL